MQCFTNRQALSVLENHTTIPLSTPEVIPSLYALPSLLPTDLQKDVLHHWQWYDPENELWSSTDRITYEVTRRHRGGFRGYTYKEYVWPGQWKGDVVTEEGLVLGVIKFRIVQDSAFDRSNLARREFN